MFELKLNKIKNIIDKDRKVGNNVGFSIVFT